MKGSDEGPISYFSFIPRHCASFKFYLLRDP